MHCFAMVYCILCIVLQWFIAYYALFCNGLLHIMHCFAMVYCILCIVLQWFIAYYALFCNGLLHCFAMVYCIFCNGLLHIMHCFAMVYCILCIVLQWFIAYYALFCNGLLHCFAMVYCIFCIVLQWFIAYFALQVVAGVMQREEKWWIRDADGVKAATALLPFTRPGELSVWLRNSAPAPALHQLAATIKQTDFGGELKMELWHSHDNFIPCDDLVKDLVKELHGSR